MIHFKGPRRETREAEQHFVAFFQELCMNCELVMKLQLYLQFL